MILLRKLFELLVETAIERVKREQSSELSEGTFRLLLSIERLAVYF